LNEAMLGGSTGSIKDAIPYVRTKMHWNCLSRLDPVGFPQSQSGGMRTR
jgi:hypothetical protein